MSPAIGVGRRRRIPRHAISRVLWLRGLVADLAALVVGEGPFAKERYVTGLAVYCDESHDSDVSSVYCVGGCIGTALQWNQFWIGWRDALRLWEIPHFHAQDCEHGRGPFKGIPVERRRSIERALLNVLTDSQIGVQSAAFAIRLETYNKLRPQMKRLRKAPPRSPISGSFDHPYLTALQYSVEQFATWPGIAQLPKEERIQFVFDRRNDLQGRAVGVFASLQRSRKVAHADRLGSLTFGDSQTLLPLQAADIVAYESFRAIMAGKEAQPRWQFSELRRGGLGVQLMDKRRVRRYLRRIEKQFGQKG